MNLSHPMNPLGTDDDGDEYVHDLTTTVVEDRDVRCAECDRDARQPDARLHDVWLVETCRGVPLCKAEGCRVQHLIRYARMRDTEAVGAVPTRKGRAA